MTHHREMSGSEKKPSIIIIGAGGIVRNGHLPAYRSAGYHVRGIYDLVRERAAELADQFGIERVYADLSEAISDAQDPVVYDLAIPASQMIPILEQLPSCSTVLLQKPMGEHIAAAREIFRICTEKKMMAGVNFQLRYAPFILKAKELMASDALGVITDVDININTYTPWHLWDFLYDIPRMEILYHSIHYIDLVRNLLGDPISLMASTIRHPSMKKLSSVRTNICMIHGDELWANILTNHCHDYGTRHQHSYVKIEGTKGAIHIKIGLLLNYPNGEPDVFEYITRQHDPHAEWQVVPIEGSWFPDAFAGSMAQMLRTFSDDAYVPDNHIRDCLNTMACVEAAYISNETMGVRPDLIK